MMEVRLIRSQNVLYGEFDFSDVVHMFKQFNEKMPSFSRVQNDDVLLNITGENWTEFCLHNNENVSIVNQHVCIIRNEKMT